MPALECSRHGNRAREDWGKRHPGQLDTAFFEYEFIFAYYHDKIFVFADAGTRRQRTCINSSSLDDPETVVAAAGTRRQRTLGDSSRLDDAETFFAGAGTCRAMGRPRLNPRG